MTHYHFTEQLQIVSCQEDCEDSDLRTLEDLRRMDTLLQAAHDLGFSPAAAFQQELLRYFKGSIPKMDEDEAKDVILEVFNLSDLDELSVTTLVMTDEDMYDFRIPMNMIGTPVLSYSHWGELGSREYLSLEGFTNAVRKVSPAVEQEWLSSWKADYSTINGKIPHDVGWHVGTMEDIEALWMKFFSDEQKAAYQKLSRDMRTRVLGCSDPKSVLSDCHSTPIEWLLSLHQSSSDEFYQTNFLHWDLEED